MNQDTDPNSIRMSPKAVDGSPSGKSPFTRLSVVLYSNRVQPALSAGISFWLYIGNGSKQVLKVQSPLEGLQISLQDGKGWPVRLPAEGTLHIGIKIDGILPVGSADPPPQTTPVPTPRSAYKLKLVVLLIAASQECAHRVFTTDYIGPKLGEVEALGFTYQARGTSAAWSEHAQFDPH